MNGGKRWNPTALVLCALFAALSAVLSQLSVPIGPVPVNLTHISVFLAAGLLGARRGAVSQLVFVLLGVAGAPVFSGLRGGLAVVAGPTGGFILGYIACAFVTGLLMERWGRSIWAAIAAMYAGWVVTYVPGIVWYIISMQASLAAALSACVVLFLPGDAVKTMISAMLIVRLHPILRIQPDTPA